jgi:DNA-binding transcriptional ArsR family regulator
MPPDAGRSTAGSTAPRPLTVGVEGRIFEALADPTRRRIIDLLAGGERTAGEIADGFPVSRPAISRHLRVLREAGLVCSRDEAQRRIYRLDGSPLAVAVAWFERYRSFWVNRIDALDLELARGRREAAPDHDPAAGAQSGAMSPNTADRRCPEQHDGGPVVAPVSRSQ